MMTTAWEEHDDSIETGRSAKNVARNDEALHF